MDDLIERAARLGIATDYWDALGQHRVADAEALGRMIQALSAHGDSPSDPLGRPAASPARGYQGEYEHRRYWALAVQLYGVRSRRNWGHGDFTDLANLIELAADVGAAGIGLNPIHALFDEWAEASPYSPSSRLFLNPRYIDVEAVPEFPGIAAAGLVREVAALQRQDLVDYAGVVAAKTRALRLAYDGFRQRATTRRRDFDQFQGERGPTLMRFAAFEYLRRKFARPWWDWPAPWRHPDDDAIARLHREQADVGLYEYLQWLAHEQLTHCLDRIRARGLPIGLYLDVAVGVRADGFDGWSNQHAMLGAVEIGAPPDALNTAGQKWGLVGFNPVALAAQACEPFRNVLRASMRYAGAVRLDHVLGLQRLFLIPSGMAAVRGLYVRFPFEALLAATAQESRANKCIVVGEDLGTVPENFRATIARHGVWSYKVIVFERNWDTNTFRAPEEYDERALATFATHDMPTFHGWRTGHDLGVKRSLAMDPGETDEQRHAAQAALGRALSARGLSLDYLSVMKYLAAVRSRLAVVTLEDVLGEIEQVNVPGTIDEHPNWRRRMAVDLEDLPRNDTLAAVAEIMAQAGRRS